MYCKECGQQIADDSIFCSKCGKSQGSVENIDLPQPEDTKEQKAEAETKPENIFGDIKAEENSTGTFLTKPLAPQGLGCSGCGCLPASGCLPAFVTTPIFIAISILLIIIFAVVVEVADNAQTPAQKETRMRQSKIKEQTINARVALELEIKRKIRDPKSYEHIETTDWVIGEFLYVKTSFRSKNAFGGKVVSTVVAEFNLNTKPMEWKITFWDDR